MTDPGGLMTSADGEGFAASPGTERAWDEANVRFCTYLRDMPLDQLEGFTEVGIVELRRAVLGRSTDLGHLQMLGFFDALGELCRTAARIRREAKPR